MYSCHMMWSRCRPLAALRQDKSGSIAVMSSVFLTLAIGISALAIDAGSLYVERRHAQGAVDLAAIAAASNIANAHAAAVATLRANGIDDFESLAVVPGQYSPDPDVPAVKRFVANHAPYNAVQVTLAKEGMSFFGKIMLDEAPTLSVTSVAASAESATFSVGSRLAAVRGGLANELLSALVGGEVTLTAMDYEALAKANVGILPFLDRLATDVGITAGTYSDVLAAKVTLGDVFQALAEVGADDHPAASRALLSVAMLAGATSRSVELNKIIDLGDLGRLALGSPEAGLGANIDFATILRAAATVANGEHQVELALGSDIPGIGSISLTLTIGEPPVASGWVSVGSPGSMVRTAQTRLKLVASLEPLAGFADIRARLPVIAQLAWAEAKLDDVTCAADSSVSEVVVAARPGIMEAWIGETTPGDMTDFGRSMHVTPAELVTIPLLAVRGKAHVVMGEEGGTALSFDEDDIADGAIKRTHTESFVAPLVSSLVGDLDLEIKALGLSLSTPKGLKSAIARQLQSVATPLDALLADITNALGVSLGEADVRVNGARCGHGRLTG